MSDLWTITENSFDPQALHYKETVFTLGNGYLSTRGAFEENYPGERRATFIHGAFDDAPIIITELANAPDWLHLAVFANGERFLLSHGSLESFQRSLDLRTGVLTRTVRWRSPSGLGLQLTFERFASLADPHLLYLRCRAVPDFAGRLEVRTALNGNVDNLGLTHWHWLSQGATSEDSAFLHVRTRQSGIEVGMAMRLTSTAGRELGRTLWDVDNRPTLVADFEAAPDQEICVEKTVAVFTSRDSLAGSPAAVAVAHLRSGADYETALLLNSGAWGNEWANADVVIEGDDEAQRAVRYTLFQLLIAAPRRDNGVSIGAKTLSGFIYAGHVFWDTEIFIVPVFTYTGPSIARNLLDYRYSILPAARHKAQTNGYEGAQFPWESAGTGEEVTPTWVPHHADRKKLVRIWTGDIEIHITADVAYATYQYWRVTGDDEWFIQRGAELVLDTAKFWASRAEWNATAGRYEYNDVIGPDEYHEHVNNNAFTNYLARWNLQTALEVLDWLRVHAPAKAVELTDGLDLSEERLAHWREVIEKIYLTVQPSGLIEQFEGYFQRKDVDVARLEPRTRSAQTLLGIEETNTTQILKQPDVLMLLYLLGDQFTEEQMRLNYEYYTPRTDHRYGSSLGPAIQSILACRVGKPDEAYEYWLLAAQADLHDVRSNAGDGIHAASAGGVWQAVVFGFGGLRVTPEGWTTDVRLPKRWKRLAFRFFHRGRLHDVSLSANGA